jgi:hypothetical protein
MTGHDKIKLAILAAFLLVCPLLALAGSVLK